MAQACASPAAIAAIGTNAGDGDSDWDGDRDNVRLMVTECVAENDRDGVRDFEFEGDRDGVRDALDGDVDGLVAAVGDVVTDAV